MPGRYKHGQWARFENNPRDEDKQQDRPKSAI